MVRAFLAALALAAALAFSASAQDQGKTKPRTWPESAPQKPGKQTVIVTGCVQAGSQPGTFILPATQQPFDSAVSKQLGAKVASPTYQLVGDANKLQGLVGHRVQVKGTTEREPEKTVKSDTGKTTTEPNARGTSGRTPKVTTQSEATIELRRLDVQQVTSVEGACK